MKFEFGTVAIAVAPRIPLQYFSTISPFVLVTKLLVAQLEERYGLIGRASEFNLVTFFF